MRTGTRTITVGAAAIASAASFLAGAYWAGGDRLLHPANAFTSNAVAATEAASAETPTAPKTNTIELLESQLSKVKVEVVTERDFPREKSAVGNIAFNEEMLTQVFTPYQGRIVDLFAKVGDEVKKGDRLFTIESPDLVQASSTLISAAAVLELTSRNLERMNMLFGSRAAAQKDLEQATSDNRTAEGAYRAARDAVRIFGKSDADIDRIVAERKVDPILVVPSPISGRITARNAAPGLLVQPGNQPAPFVVADISTMWMVANVAESDTPAFSVGQDVRVTVMAYPNRVFTGRISTIGSTVDPMTHRLLVRSEIDDPKHELRSGMLASFVISIGAPMRSVAVPVDGVVREGDGTMTVWVTADRRRFTRRSVKV
ncbi:MAG: efflux RND transporter periplasmic adaptor subunit, partial [Bradyrhizobiaceae bacterium]|nr:efflux RND transporter periplasmic adaptor subunit [Bradyrhizobiaceae bacterium]